MIEYSNEKIKRYTDEMPAEIRRAIAALNDDVELAILFVLFDYGIMTLSCIMDELDIQVKDNGEVIEHIKKLQKSSLVKSEYIKEVDGEGHSFYDITEFGENIIYNLMNAIQK